MADIPVIDFHVHFFPDNIAKRAVESLSQAGNVKPNGDGTAQSLVKYMKEDGVTLAVNQPVATKAEQVKSINRQMVEFNKTSKEVISFGTMHPEFDKLGMVREELEFLSHNGVKGIKLHPEYQEFYPDAPEMVPIYEACRDFGLTIVFHCGKDIAFKTVHATPKRMAEVAKIKSLRIVCGHMGGYQMWDEVETFLIGLPGVYLDTAYSLEMEDWQMKEIIFAHGAFNILYASDFPWQRQKSIIDKIKALGLGPIPESQIFHKNAELLLNLS